MEDYKTLYEQRLERAKEEIKKCGDDKGRIGMIENIFPELKESEDEKIMKDLIGYFKVCGNTTFAHHSVSDVIAWLEKQDEQKSIDNLRWNELTWEDVNTIEEIINEVHSDFRNGIGAESFGEEVLERFRNTKGDEYVDTCEQNPAWSEEDEKMLHEISQCIYNNVVNIGTVNKVKYIDWLKSLKERYFWKPNDEQIEMLENVRKILHSNEDIYSKANNLMYSFEELIRILMKLKEG